MSFSVRLWLCGLLVLTGCKTGPRPGNGSGVPDWEEQPGFPSAVPVPEPIVTPPPTPPPTNPPAPPIVSSNRVMETWVSLNRWSQSNGYGSLQRTATGATPTFSLTTTNGVLDLRKDDLAARWNGLELRLGFGPQLIDNRLFVHQLDLQKNILPLLKPAPAMVGTNLLIVIDPGHGGRDVGTQSVFPNQFEKDFTLDWALRLEQLLATNGWRVVLTRTNDREVSLSNRVAVAQQQQADLFVSLHFNSSSPNQEQAGLETYCLTPVGMASTLTRGYTDDASLVFPNNAFDERNLQYAVRLHRALLEVNGHADRGVRRARFLGVLRGQNRPAVLLEGGYLSNRKEAQLIADPAYRQKLAVAVAKALSPEVQTQTAVLLNAASTESNQPPAPAPAPAETKNAQ